MTKREKRAMPAKTNRVQTHLIMVATALFFIHPAAQADNDELALYEGDRNGFYQPDEGEREKAKFIVKNPDRKLIKNRA